MDATFGGAINLKHIPTFRRSERPYNDQHLGTRPMAPWYLQIWPVVGHAEALTFSGPELNGPCARGRYLAKSMGRRQNELLGMSPIDSPSKTTPRKDLLGLVVS